RLAASSEPEEMAGASVLSAHAARQRTQRSSSAKASSSGAAAGRPNPMRVSAARERTSEAGAQPPGAAGGVAEDRGGIPERLGQEGHNGRTLLPQRRLGLQPDGTRLVSQRTDQRREGRFGGGSPGRGRDAQSPNRHLANVRVIM